MLCPATNTAVIGRLRIRSKSPDPQTDRYRLRNMLGNASLSPSRLPSSALLVVRKLENPLPLRLRVTRLDMQLDPRWQRAVNAELDSLLSQAARPALQSVPTGAVSVLFLDRSELLAALALDWMSGALPQQWWWREFFRNTDPVTSVLIEWTRSPQFVPAALHLLSQRSRAVAFVRCLPQGICSELLEATLRAHALPQPPSARLDKKEDNASRQTTDGVDRDGPAMAWTIPRAESAGDGSGREHSLSGFPHPWQPWVPEASTPGLSPVQRLLLAQTLMLARAPVVVRTARFQSELLLWEALVSQDSTTGNPESPDNRVTGLFSQSLEAGLKNEAAGQQDKPTRHPSDLETGDSSAGQIENKRTDGSDGQTAGSPDRPIMNDSGHRIVEIHESAGPVNVGHDGLESPKTTQVRGPVASRSLDHRTTEAGSSIETSFGGIFFLLHAALILNIYADFSSPLGQNLELNIWDFLALSGSEFVGAEIESDPVWEMLAILAGRGEGQRPGASFDPPSEWQLPPGWLDAFPEPYESQVVSQEGRLVDIHPAGFPILDVPASVPSQAPPVDLLKRWLGWLTAYLRARLQRAMGRNDAAELLCRQPARLTLTHSHLDVTFSLSHHPFEVRFAGLDRDPGWIPAAGRYVAFHFD